MKIRNQIFQITASLFFVTTLAQAQFKNAGAGLAYGVEIAMPGIALNGQYFFSEKVALTPSFIFYFPDTEESSYSSFGFNFTTKAKSTVWELNADVNYYFFDQGIKLFGVGGLNLTGVKSKVTTTSNNSQIPGGETSASDTNVGINLGIGADFKAGDKIVPFALMKYTVSDYDQLVLMGGVRFLLK